MHGAFLDLDLGLMVGSISILIILILVIACLRAWLHLDCLATSVTTVSILWCRILGYLQF